MTLPDTNPPEKAVLSFASEGDFEFNMLLSGDWVQDNYEMYEKYGMNEPIAKLDRPTLLNYIKFRLDFLQEEINEAQAAYLNLAGLGEDTPNIDPGQRQAVAVNAGDDIVDAMIDLCVVAIGTLNSLNVDAYEAWDRVHQANTQKIVGIKASRPNPFGLPDLVKPAGWTSPSHADNIGLIGKFAE